MTAYYNENDKFMVAWLRALIARKLIADGEVDDRSIKDVTANDLRGFAQCHFFAGLGGWSYALRLAGWPDDRPVWIGSCPCQPFSNAGKRKGFADERHLWPVWYPLIRECRPSVVFGEQVASAAAWLKLVRSDLEAVDYAMGCLPIEAASAGADHLRDRFWFVADSAGLSQRVGDPGIQRAPLVAFEGKTAERDGVAHADIFEQGDGGLQRGGQFGGASGDQEARSGDVADAAHGRRPDQCFGDEPARQHVGAFAWADSGSSIWTDPERDRQAVSGGQETSGFYEWAIGADGKARRVKPGIRLLAHGVPARVAKLRAFGNAIDPRPAAEFIGAYLDGVT